jgi:diguanylate cyclase (GGDEF)-like protein
VNSAPGRFLASFALPAGAVLVGFALLLRVGALPLSLPVVQFYAYAAFGAAALLAWRFQSSRILVALLLLALAAKGLPMLAAGHGITAGPGRTAFDLIAFLLPLNFIALSFTRERGLTDARCGLWLASLFVQAVGVTAVCRADGAHLPALESVFASGLLPPTRVPQPALLMFALAFIIIIVRFTSRRRAIESGLFWSLTAALLAMNAGGVGRLSSAYFATGAVVLVVSLIETSYFMSYHDELTGLRARRAFNQALLALDDGYTIAMVDVDHFKKFNDTFGHDTGDQVLRMVSAKLSQVSGGGSAFRCGGEEFAVVFAGKSTKQAYPHLESLRQSIEEATFVVRSPERVRRSKEDRGSAGRDVRVAADRQSKIEDRRSQIEDRRSKIEDRHSNIEDRRASARDRRSIVAEQRINAEVWQSDMVDLRSNIKGRRSNIEDLRSNINDRRRTSRRRRPSPASVEVFVTVSIGLAEASTRLVTADLVLQAADKALYRAKDAGRNRVEIYRPARVRTAASRRQPAEGALFPTETR